jgi:hypothetical protein
MQALEAHAIAAVDDVRGGHRARGGEHARGAPAPQQAAADHRLQVRVAQPGGRAVVAGGRRLHRIEPSAGTVEAAL